LADFLLLKYKYPSRQIWKFRFQDKIPKNLFNANNLILSSAVCPLLASAACLGEALAKPEAESEAG